MKYQFEAAILAAGRPVTTQQLSELFDERERPSLEQVLNALQALREDYESRGLYLIEVSSGWRIQVRSNCVDFVSRLWQERPSRYSRALLETLALIAYRQPITRGEIEEIRGVAVSSTIMRTLHDRNWIRIVGHREVPGRPELLATTKEFLDYFGLKSLDQLPTLAELKDVETIGVQLEFNTTDAVPAANDEVADAIAGEEGVNTEGQEASADAAGAEVASADATDAESVEVEAPGAEAEVESEAAAAKEVTEEEAVAEEVEVAEASADTEGEASSETEPDSESVR
ncbi:MAG: SMC-Scp complex subunit ScpB [Steroidobacteraceae bacterium]